MAADKNMYTKYSSYDAFCSGGNYCKLEFLTLKRRSFYLPTKHPSQINCQNYKQY